VRDINDGVARYTAIFGPPSLVTGGAEVGYHRAVFELGHSGQKVELCQPLDPGEPGGDSQASRAFRNRLTKSGEGLHNLAVRVASVADTRERLTAHDLPLITSAHSETFFVHPDAAAGALMQFMP
jgi:hypothetical protein